MTLEPKPYGAVVAKFNHTCGHQVPMYYGGAEFAEFDRERQEARKCLLCENSEHLSRTHHQQ